MGTSSTDRKRLLRRPRAWLLALAFICLAAMFTALATASSSRHHKHVVVRHNQNGAYVGSLIKALNSKNPLRALSRLNTTRIPARIRAAARSGPTSTTGVPITAPAPTPPAQPYANATRVLAAATDWPYSYSLLLKRRLGSINDSFDSVTPISLIRRNAQTGERTVLMRMRRAFPWAVRAGGGRVFVALLDSSSTRSVKTRIVAFDSGSTNPVQIASDNISTPAGGEDDEACGRLSMLNDADSAGEAIITRLTGTCSTDGQRDFDMETVAIARDGATRILDPIPSPNMLALGRVQLSGDFMLSYGPLVGTFNVLNLPAGTKTRIWDVETSNNASIAGDGTVVVGPGLTTDDSQDFNPYFYFVTRVDPFVVFAPGDPNNPTALADANYKSIAMHYCSNQLYELRLPRFVYPDSTAGTAAMIDGLPVVSALQIVARNTTGGEARQIATTEKVWLRSIGCDGDALVLTTDRRNGVDAQRYGP